MPNELSEKVYPDGTVVKLRDDTARELITQINTALGNKVEGLVYSRADNTSLTARMDAIKAQNKNGAYIMYCSSANPDFATIGYCTAIGLTINGAVSVIIAVNSQTGDIWTNGNTSQNAGAWTGWKKISKDSGTTLGSSVSLNSYSSSSNKYTVPSDGYVMAYAGSGTGFNVYLDSVNSGTEVIKISSADGYNRQSIFVKKGMKVYGYPTGGSSYQFYYYPLQ